MTIQRLDSAELATLGNLADVLIPPAAGAHSATQAGVTEALLQQAESYAPDLPARLRKVIELAGQRPAADVLRDLKRDDSAAYDGFCETIAAIYFMSPTVRASVGFPGREPALARVDTADLEELLLPVLEGGFGPRPTDGDGREE